MEIIKIASGSDGNCYRVNIGGYVLMLECGIRFSVINRAFDFDLSGVHGCLISHGHQDHCLSAKKLIDRGVNCYMSKDTADQCLLDSHRVKVIEHGVSKKIGTITIIPFNTVHDAPGSLGFLIANGVESLLFVTDTARIDSRFRSPTHVMIEANFSEDLLYRNCFDGKIDSKSAQRIHENHMSAEKVIDFFATNEMPRLKEIHLIHISKRNGNPKLFAKMVSEATGKKVYT